MTDIVASSSLPQIGRLSDAGGACKGRKQPAMTA